MHRIPRFVSAAFVAALCLTIACADDSTSNDDSSSTPQNPEDCTADQFYNSVLRKCVDRADAGGDNNGTNNGNNPTNNGDNNGTDDVGTDTSSPDTRPDVVEEDTPDTRCDMDEDGVMSVACGGNDCDDNDCFGTPGRNESCDNKDNDCDGAVNNGIACTFVAHTGANLYAVYPFNMTATIINEVPGLQDIDTEVDGTLWGVTRAELFRLDARSNQWVSEGTFPNRIEDANGLAIDSQGTAYVTSGDSMYEVDLSTATTRWIGQVGTTFYSSGDCVVNKVDSLYMTSKEQGLPDTLVFVDRSTGHGQAVGSIGFDRVFGLTAGWGTLYGLTYEGELISIDPSTGRGTLLHTFPDITWFGAASTPSR